jgi:alginate O-acetyltransferase complex protein AlgI
MVLGGLWHGANWTFILWGAWHGVWLAVERALGAKSKASVWPALIAWPLTMTAVMIGWVMFRAASVTEAFQVYAGMIGLNGWSLSDVIAWQIQPTEIAALIVGSVLSVFGQRLTAVFTNTPDGLRLISNFALMSLACIALLAQTHSPFLYFQF